MLSSAFVVSVLSALVLGSFPAVSVAAPGSTHEITAGWAGTPAPTDAPFASTRTAEYRVNTNDAASPEQNEPVDNVRATLTAGNGVFTSIPAVCKTSGVEPVSAISEDGSTLLCNLGTIVEGTATVIQAPIRVSGTEGGDLTVSGTATSDDAVAEAGPASPAPLPITYSHGMDLTLEQAPGQNFQGAVRDTSDGSQRPIVKMNFSLILEAGSRPGPESYSFPVNVSGSVAGSMTGFRAEGCVPVGTTSRSTGQPYSVETAADRTNFPACSVTGSGSAYTVTVSDLDYTLVNTPVNDSLGQPLPGTGAYIASGTVEFSIPSPVTQLTTYAFSAAGSPDFTFADGVTTPDPQANNASSATLPPPGGFSNTWYGQPTNSRNHWDANLWVSPGTSADIELPAVADMEEWREVVASGNVPPLPLYMQANTRMWAGYTGPGGPQMAGVCTMNQNPAFVPTHVDGGGWDSVRGYENFETARYFYTTQLLDTKTETCGDAAPSTKWIEVSPEPGTSLNDPRIGTDSLMTLPAGVTGVKMTWDPAVDVSPGAAPYAFLRVLGHISPDAPLQGEGWTVGAFNAPGPGLPAYPELNGWRNYSTAPDGIDLPGSTYGPNMNGSRDAFRLQGAQGSITKSTSQTTAEPGVPVTYNLSARANISITSPPAQTFTVVDTLPEGMEYVAGSGSPEPVVDGRTLTWTFTEVPANVAQAITYQAQRPADSVIPPGTSLVNVAQVNVPGDQRPVAARQARAAVTVPNASATNLGKSIADNVLSFYGDTSSWNLTLNSQDPEVNPYTDTIDILPAVGDGRGTNIDGSYTITGVDAPEGSTVYYSTAPLDSLSNDPRDPSNGGTPGSVDGNTVGWSTAPVPNPTAIRVLGPALEPGATQQISINFTTPAGTDCVAPAEGDNKPGQVLVNSANSIAGHTLLPMLSSAAAAIGDCYALDLKKYVLVKGGDPDNEDDWRDANAEADYPQYLVGDAVPFRIIATNKGTGELNDVVIADSLIPDCGTTVASIAAGASAVVDCEMTAALGTTVNTASASVTPPTGPPLTPEDPAGFLVPEPYTVAKTADPASGATVQPGDVVRYTVTVTEPSTSAAPYLNPSITDDLSEVLDDAAYNGDITVVEPNNGTASITDGILTWTADRIMPGQTITLTYSVTVSGPFEGDGELLNVVTPGEGGECVPVEGQDAACTTSHLKGGYTVSKTSDPANGSEVAEGDKITYTVEVAQVGPAAVSGAVATDDLSKVLDDASYNGDADATAGEVAIDEETQELVWSGDLEVDDTVTITYSVTVGAASSGDGTLTNVVAPGAGGVCIPAPDQNADCTTTHTAEKVTPPTLDPPKKGGLADTGLTAGPFALGGVVILLLGASVVAASKLRRREEV